MDEVNTLDSTQVTLSWKERIGYSLGEFGQNFLMSMAMTFALYYQTKVALIPAAIIGVINLFFPWFDLVTDLFYAWVIDHPRIKIPGKWKNGGWFRPWVVVFAPLWSLSFVMSFMVPMGSSLTGKIIWLIIWRVFYSIFVDYVNGPHGALMCRITRKSSERNILSMLNGIFVLLTVIIVQITVPLIKKQFESEWTGYLVAGIIFALMQWILSWISMASVKERVKPIKVRNENESFRLKEMVAIVKKIPYLYGWVLSAILRQIAEGLLNSLTVFYFIYYLAIDESKMGFAVMISGALIIPAVITAPLLSKKIGKRNTYLLGLYLAMVSAFLRFFAPVGMTGFWMMVALGSIGSIGIGLFLSTSAAIGADINDYAEYKTGERIEGMISGVSLFIKKILGGLATAIPAFILGWIGFNEGSDVQSIEVINGIRIASTLGTGFFYILSIVVFSIGFPLGPKKLKEINEELNRRRLSNN